MREKRRGADASRMIPAGQIVPLTIEKPAAGGRMIARLNGLVVLVSGAIPGERVRARIERVGKGVAYAEAVDLEDASPDRRPVRGDPRCGGCLYAHVSYPRQLTLKSLVIADAFARVGRMELPRAVQVAPSPEQGYRMRARLHLGGRVVGFFREGTHEICDARQTGQLLPATTDALDALAAGLVSLGIERVRDIELTENLDASSRVVHLDLAAGAPRPDARTLDRLAASGGLTGLSTRGAVSGADSVIDRISIDGCAPVSLRRHVLAFFQGNRYLLERLVAHVIGQVPPGGDVVDLYAGVGLFAVTAAVCRDARVTAVEGDRIAAADLAANAAAADGAVEALHRPVEAFEPRRPPDTLIVDPPRTGLSRVALDAVLGMRASRLVYVSCDVATLARDGRGLVDGGYELTGVEAFDLFPNTPHVETVAIFQRVGVSAGLSVRPPR